MLFPNGRTVAFSTPAFPSTRKSSSVLSRPGNSTPTVGRQTTAKKRIGKSVTGLVLTLGLCLRCGPTMIRPLIQRSGFLTELGDVFADPAFPPTRSRSAMPCKRGCFRRANAPAILVHKPTPNFAVGRGLIPRPLLPRCGSTRHPGLEIEVRLEPFAKGHGDSRCIHCEPENAAHVADSAVTNARFCSAARAAGRPCLPLDHARSTPQARALVTSGHLPDRKRMCAVLPSAARRRDVTLRLRFVRCCSPPSAPLSPLTDHRPKPRQAEPAWVKFRRGLQP
jgi:hypothetical protein